MADLADQTTKLQGWIERFQAGDEAARDKLIEHTYERLRRLTRRMLKGYPRMKRWDESGDVLHNALLRLLRALAEVKPATLQEFFGLAATQIRRELIDLTRHYYGPQGPGAHEEHAANADGPEGKPYDKPETTHEPSRLAEWGEFHEQVDRLPDKERQVFDLLYYHELSQPEAARVLQVSKETIKARWRSARLKLHHVLRGERGRS
jgi:RNA polymerase sigma-70 factor (ECF subfamily)